MGDIAQASRHRALFISDVHLGSRACKAEELLEFLQHNDADTVFLVGDVVDLWSVRRGAYWPNAHSAVLSELWRKSRAGSRLILIPGNHDAHLRAFCALTDGIEICREAVHETAKGARLLVVHGDEFDFVMQRAGQLARVADRCKGLWLRCLHALKGLSAALGLASHVPARQLRIARRTRGFETAVADEAARRGMDGVICGHVHHPADRIVRGVRYVNCGDWVSSCTAVAETAAGEFRIIRWRQARARAHEDLAEPPVPAIALGLR